MIPRAFQAGVVHHILRNLGFSGRSLSNEPNWKQTSLDGDEVMITKIAWAHLKEIPDYYTHFIKDGKKKLVRKNLLSIKKKHLTLV